MLRKQKYEQCFAKYSERLLALRKKTASPWQGIVENALTQLNVDDTLELKTAMAGMKDICPLLVPRDTTAGWTYSVYTDTNDRPAVFFAADGKRLRVVKTLFDDWRVYDWDLSTSKMLPPVELPKNIKIASIRESDGRFAICYEDKKAGDGGENRRADAMQVLDLDTGRSIIDVAIPPCDNILWINDHEAFAIFRSIEYGKSDSLCRFDYRSGRRSEQTIPWSERRDYLGDCELAEDGRLLFLPGCDIRGRIRSVWAIYDPTTKNLEKHGAIDGMYPVHKSCTVPGSKYFCLYDPDFYVVDRHTFKEISTISLLKAHIRSHSFSSDGQYLALVTGAWNDPMTPSIVRIHEVQTGKTVLAFPASPPWPQIKFSPDGRRLALVYSNGTIEVWPLPNITGTRTKGVKGT